MQLGPLQRQECHSAQVQKDPPWHGRPGQEGLDRGVRWQEDFGLVGAWEQVRRGGRAGRFHSASSLDQGHDLWLLHTAHVPQVDSIKRSIIFYIDKLFLMFRIKLFYEKDTEHAGLQTYRFLSEKDLVSSALPIVTTHCSCWVSLYICTYILCRFIPDIKQLASHTDPDPAVIKKSSFKLSRQGTTSCTY